MKEDPTFTLTLQSEFEGVTLREWVASLHNGEVRLTPKPPRYSATTLKQGKDCLRAWWWDYVAGVSPDSSPAQKWGTLMHSHLEAYLKHGTIPPQDTPQGRAATNGLKLLPAPKSVGLRVEEPFERGTWPGGPTFTGTKDWWLGPAGYDPDDGYRFNTERLTLGDHKSSKAFRRYPVTPETLRADGQFISYAHDLLSRFPQFDAIDGRWNYFGKVAPHPVDPVSLNDVPRSEIRGRWEEEILPTIEGLHKMHQAVPRLRDLPRPKEPDAKDSPCVKWGGCPHRAHCVDYRPKATNPSLVPLLAKHAAETTQTTPAAASQEGKNMAANPALQALLNKKQSQSPTAKVEESKVKVTQVVQQTAQSAAPGDSGSVSDLLAQIKIVSGGTKPAEVKSPEDVADFPPTQINPPAALNKPVLPEVKGTIFDPAEVETKAVETETKGKGKAKKAALAAETPAQTALGAQEGLSPAQQELASRRQKYWLFIDAQPIKDSAKKIQNLNEWLDKVASELTEKLGKYYSTEEFGKGNTGFAAAVDAKLRAEPLTGSWYVKPSPEWDAAKGILMSRAAEVVVSTR